MNNYHITIQRALAGLDLENYKFLERAVDGACIEYKFEDEQRASNCLSCDSTKLLSKGFSYCAYRHFLESEKRSFIVVRKRKYICGDCKAVVTRHPNFVTPTTRFTQPYAEYLAYQVSNEGVPLIKLAKQEDIPLNTVRKLFRQIGLH